MFDLGILGIIGLIVLTAIGLGLGGVILDAVVTEFHYSKVGVMKLFNAIQIATLFGLFPFLINWLWTAEFNLAGTAFWVALVAYIIFYVWIIYMVYQYLDKSDKKV